MRIRFWLDSENQPGSWSGKIQTGSGALRLTGDVWHQKYENKKEGFKNYLNIHSILFIFKGFSIYLAPGWNNLAPRSTYVWYLMLVYLIINNSAGLRIISRHTRVLKQRKLTKISQTIEALTAFFIFVPPAE